MLIIPTLDHMMVEWLMIKRMGSFTYKLRRPLAWRQNVIIACLNVWNIFHTWKCVFRGFQIYICSFKDFK